MNERDRVILGMSDVELLKFHQMGGEVPAVLVERVRRMLGSASRERHRHQSPAELTMRTAPHEDVRWRPSPLRVRKRAAAERRRAALRYALENLTGIRQTEGTAA